MKRLLCVALLAVTGFAAADELADANRLLAAKEYGKALPIYQRLAEAGNPEAQLRLGEMLWFGDATRPDLAKAAQWFRKSAAAGNADAAASLASLQRRETHGGEIVYWTTAYQGEDLVSGKFDCKTPALPVMSKTAGRIKTVSASVDAWRSCYTGLVANVNAQLPAGKAIPADVVDMMTPAEAQQAQRHLQQVYSRVVADAGRQADIVTAQAGAWMDKTQKYVAMAVVRDRRLNDMFSRGNEAQEYATMNMRDRYAEGPTIITVKR